MHVKVYKRTLIILILHFKLTLVLWFYELFLLFFLILAFSSVVWHQTIQIERFCEEPYI